MVFGDSGLCTVNPGCDVGLDFVSELDGISIQRSLVAKLTTGHGISETELTPTSKATVFEVREPCELASANVGDVGVVGFGKRRTSPDSSFAD